MMDESDDDFKELCASFFQRVKKNGTKEVSGERKTKKSSNVTQPTSKPAATKSKTLKGPRERKPRSGSQATRTKKQGAPTRQEGEPAPSENGEGSVLASAMLWRGAWSTQPGNPGRNIAGTSTEETREAAPNGDSQPPPCLTATVPSPSKPRAAEMVVQRMQQFKRADPERLKHASEGCSLQPALEENIPKDPRAAMMVENGSGPWLPATESDTAVALALQQEFGQEGAAAPDGSLEEKGLFFCQICQKNLSAMNVTRREQHVNRCLDESEKTLRPCVPQVPECPICGKPFLTSKSRISHLKQCAVKMEVDPQLLLQAVRLQTAQPEGTCSTLAQTSSFSNHVGGLKRKGAPNRKEPQKRQKVSEREGLSEDLLVAMALSRSEMEQEVAPAMLPLGTAFPGRTKLSAEKKSRKKKGPVTPPQLLVQDLETTGRQIEDRVAQLFAEEEGELSNTPPLPASRLLKEELGKASKNLHLPEGKQNFLWEGSALTGAWALESFYTASLVPPMVPQQSKGPTLPPVLSEQPQLAVHTSPALHSATPRNLSPSASQREYQALQDLMDLAREGLSASPLPCSGGSADSKGTTGTDLLPGGLPLTGFVLPPEEQRSETGGQASLSLGLLVADFSAMVNNPHLSDVQFQMDDGEVLYAHKFVLYARCPLLIQYVNNEGFFAVEDGDLRTQRVLLSDVSTEAARAFLHYLYTADTGLPPQLTPDLSSLACRFGVSELVHLCEQASVMMDSEDRREEKEDEDCETRAENFQELLRSMWVGEEEETEALLKSEGLEEDREKVNEAEMEEIYEFAATQRKLLQGERAPEIKEETNQRGEDSPGPRRVLANIQVKEESENTEQMEPSGQGRDECLSKRKDERQSMFLPLKGQCSNGEEEAEAAKEALDHTSSSHSSQGRWAGKQEGHVMYSANNADDEQPFPSTPGGHPEPSQVTSDHMRGSGTLRQRRGQSSPRSSRRQTPPPHPCFFLSQPPPGRSPRQPHLHPHHKNDLSPPTPQSQGRASRVASQDTQSKQKRGRNLLTLFNHQGCQKGEERGSVLEYRNKETLTSPEKSPSIDLTQAKPDQQSSRSQNSPSKVNREDEIILLLDSDEELELEQTKIKSVFNGPLEEKVLEASPKFSDLFSIIDVDADQEPPPSPPRREAAAQQQDRRPARNPGCVGGRGSSQLFCNRESSPDEDSTTDTSWLVPATPLGSRSHEHSSQTQIMGLGSRTAAYEMAQLQPRAPLENRDGLKATSKFSAMVHQTSSSCLVPVNHRSPSSPSPRRHKPFSVLTPCPASGGLTDCGGQFQKHSLPRPSLPSQATASEVVEVEDSEDEQEVASHQASSSSLLDSGPPIPTDDCCWQVEPLSPIPIDNLNLERTGPLSTSSPGSRARESPDSGDCHSPALLSTTPIRGSCTGQRKSQEKPPQASSPGGNRLSFLNSALWDDWDGEQKSPEAPSLPQTPTTDRAQKSEGLEKPSANRRKNLPPKVPITPMPRYSIMETPVLKKELDRFGVRPLPKRQMVLKLKEIFQYTHQTLESDSEDESQSSQAPLEAPRSQVPAAKASKASRAVGRARLQATSDPVPRRPKGPAKTKGPRRGKQPGGGILHMSPAKEVPPGPDSDAPLPASQESTATSVDSSDSSLSSQSSSLEFGAALESAGEEEEGEEGVSASQAAVQAVATEEAVRRYIRSTPALYRKVLLYQPFELAELQAELKRQGIRMATRKLLDFLDAHCITFTTASARKEKVERKRQLPAGKKKRGRTDGPVRRSPPVPTSSL
ncbi:structure-specific endonuclease subunit SLX4 isoform X2 [Pipistrellus kuhlii]|uniref:Structure-specific endonuclease subunit SLX4 n=1 Tax=Pipistrellus kuhlii TaxID=59472 RepID=A0A7J7YYH7_PIPKU|nr:structure-specific endonuclease subunit SLX4 isoform X2 [Pipistrellus kuhlii]KAF6367087.1 SLX4 structure-specific endonuclease subunit [Pipistrellus kuhlii]